MKTLLVGASSSIGKTFLANGDDFFEVVTAGRRSSDIVLDLSRPSEPIRFPSGIETLIQTSANFGGNDPKDFIDAFEINLIGTLRLAKAALEGGVEHFIYISSIFSLLKKGSPHFTSYSLSKSSSEEALELFCDINSIPLTIIRPPQLYGGLTNLERRQPFLSQIIERASKGEEVTIFGSHDPKINLLHLSDLDRVIKEIAKRKVLGTFNCLNTNDISYSEFAETAFSVFGKEPRVKFMTEMDDIKDNTFDKSENLFQVLGLKPEMTLKDGINEIAQLRYNRG